jgi:hypothetical protein
MADFSMPWRTKTPQEKGRQTETRILREQGVRAHPGSGSGSIRFDGSTDTDLVEIKEAKKSLHLTLSYLQVLSRTAIRQSKDVLLIIKMPGIRMECRIYPDIDS